MMVVCNICGLNVSPDDIQPPFRYVCKACWWKAEITVEGEPVDKDIIY